MKCWRIKPNLFLCCHENSDLKYYLDVLLRMYPFEYKENKKIKKNRFDVIDYNGFIINNVSTTSAEELFKFIDSIVFEKRNNVGITE